MSTSTTDSAHLPLTGEKTAGKAGWRVARWNLERVRETLRTRTFWLCSVLSFVALSLAFQIPYTYSIDFGTRPDRFVILAGMHDGETDGAQTFRWTRAQAEFRFPALVGGAWQFEIDANGWQPEGGAAVQIQVGESLFSRESTGDWQEWKFDVNAPAGDLDVALDADTFKPSDSGNADTRELGVRLDSLRLFPVGGGMRLPPLLGYVLPLTLGVMLLYASAAGQIREHYLLALTAVVVALLFGAIAFYRVYLNGQVVWTWLLAMVGGLLFMLFGMDMLRGLYRLAGFETDRTTLNRLGLIVLGFLILKAVGSFYPGMYIIDQIFHLHRLEFVREANLFFVTRSREFGSLETVYPPALYVFLSPLATLLGDDLGLIRLSVILFEAVGGLMLFAVARLARLSARAGLFAVLLYLGSPIAFITFGWGVYSNLFAQQLLIFMLALWFATQWQNRPVKTAVLMALVLIVGLLSHASMIILLSLYWGLVSVANWLLFQRERARAVFVFGALAAGLLIAFAVYFSFFVDKTLDNIGALQARTASASAQGFERVVGNGLAEVGIGLVPVRVHSPIEWIAESASYLVRESWVYYRTIPVLFALLGLLWMWREPALKNLAVVLFFGLLLVLAFFLVGMFFNVYTRYMLFGAPFIALGAPYILDRLAGRGLPGRAVVVGTLALVIVSGIGFWFTRVVY